MSEAACVCLQPPLRAVLLPAHRPTRLHRLAVLRAFPLTSRPCEPGLAIDPIGDRPEGQHEERGQCDHKQRRRPGTLAEAQAPERVAEVAGVNVAEILGSPAVVPNPCTLLLPPVPTTDGRLNDRVRENRLCDVAHKCPGFLR